MLVRGKLGSVAGEAIRRSIKLGCRIEKGDADEVCWSLRAPNVLVDDAMKVDEGGIRKVTFFVKACCTLDTRLV